MSNSLKKMSEKEQEAAARAFVERWSAKAGYEKGECQKFWMDLLANVFGVENFADFVLFEEQVKEYSQSKTVTNFIDVYIPATRVMIEQKSCGKDLREPIKQSDGRLLTPFQQAKKYVADLPLSKHPRWIITCNFDEFLIYDMEQPDGDPQQLFLKDLPKEIYRLQFLVDSRSEHIRREEEISLKAGELVGELYDALFKEYINPDERSFRSLNILCVRIVFCLYAEDAGLFDTKTVFEDYIQSFKLENVRHGLIELFKALDTKPENRDKYDTKLNPFPYVNGGLFAYEDIEIPNFSQEIVDVIVNHCAPFDWSEISPTIFGAVFESTLNPETRRKGGMHYTSIENIHKVIDPLFLDDLKAEFQEIGPSKTKVLSKSQRQKFLTLQDKLSKLKFLDPACGSGNFLTETYSSLRKLENEIIKQLADDKILMGEIANPIKVSIDQFFGIEINDFAVNVAKTALWIAESQMLKETENIVQRDIDFLPLKTNATIVEGNALRMDWEKLGMEDPTSEALIAGKLNIIQVDDIDSLTINDRRIPYKQKKDEITVITREIEYKDPKEIAVRYPIVANHYDYIMGNPPFVGARMMNAEQKSDIEFVFGKARNLGNLDYVSCWFKKAFDLVKETETKAALVSTNSVTQGEQPAILWKPLFDEGLQIDFAYRTFRWDSESENKAHVHCVIVGFSSPAVTLERPQGAMGSTKRIFLPNGNAIPASNINAYLMDAPDTFIGSRQRPLCNVPDIGIGNKPIDGGNYLFTDDEKDAFVKKEPASEPFFKKWIGSDEFINRYNRWCLWLGDCTPTQIRQMRECYKRVQAVREFRLASKSVPTQRLAERPTRFHVENFPEGDYLLIPRVSSERRRYIPIGFVQSDYLCSDSVHVLDCSKFIDNISPLFYFGILTSGVHMAWVRAVCGRLKSDYRYSKDIVYNNFPWPGLEDRREKRGERNVKSGEREESNSLLTPQSSILTSDSSFPPKMHRIEATAQAILDVRAKYPDSSLADLYDELTMPTDLRKAHTENDRAVMEAYGFNPKMSEDEIVAELFKMYEGLAKQNHG